MVATAMELVTIVRVDRDWSGVFAPFGGSGVPSGGTGCDLDSSGEAGSCLPLRRPRRGVLLEGSC